MRKYFLVLLALFSVLAPSLVDAATTRTSGKIENLAIAGYTDPDNQVGTDDTRPQVINVAKLGAKGDDATDNRAIIQAAIDANPKATIFIPRTNGVGIYRSSGAIYLTDDTGRDFQGRILSDGGSLRCTNNGNATDTDANMQNCIVAYPKTRTVGSDVSGWNADDNQAVLEGLTVIGPRNGAGIRIANSINVHFERVNVESNRYGFALESTINVHFQNVQVYDWRNAGIGLLYTQNPKVYYGINPPDTQYNDNVHFENVSFADGPTDGTGACILDMGSSAERTRFFHNVSCQGKTGNTGVQYGYLARNVHPTFIGSNWFEAINYPIRIISSNAAEGGSSTTIPGITASQPSGTFTVGRFPDGFCTGGVFMGNYSSGALVSWQPDCNGTILWGGNFSNGADVDIRLTQGGKKFIYFGDVRADGAKPVIENSYGGFIDLASKAANVDIDSGFGTGASVNAESSDAFTVGVGTGGTANSGVLVMSEDAPNGWACECQDITTVSSTVAFCRSSPTSTNKVTLKNYNSSLAQAAWASGDTLQVSCKAR